MWMDVYLVPVVLEIPFLPIFLLIDKEEEEEEGSLLIFYKWWLMDLRPVHTAVH